MSGREDRNDRPLAHPFYGLPRLQQAPRTPDELDAQATLLVRYAQRVTEALRDQSPADVHLALAELNREQHVGVTVALAAMLDTEVNPRSALAWTAGLVPGSQIPITAARDSNVAA